MTTEGPDLDALERLAEQATPGPWMWSHAACDCWWINGEAQKPVVDGFDTDRPEQNAAYIAALDPATVLALIRLALLGQAWEAAEVAGMKFPGSTSSDGRFVIPTSGTLGIAVERYESGDGYFEPHEFGYRAIATISPLAPIISDFAEDPAAALQALANALESRPEYSLGKQANDSLAAKLAER